MTVLADRWKTGDHIGPARPTRRARIRLGRFYRRYDAWVTPPGGEPVDATIHNPSNAQSNTDPWQAFWTPDDTTPPDYGWVEIPNVMSVERANGFTQNGISTATIHIENIVAAALPGDGHSLNRGYMAPLRGYLASFTDENGVAVAQLTDPVRDLLNEVETIVETNDWESKFNRVAQIEVFEGYGDAEQRVFVGFIDDMDATSLPDTIVITARMGLVLTESRVFGWNKDPDIKDPVVFIDKDEADDVKRVMRTPGASSEVSASYSAENVADGDSSTMWRSIIAADPAWTEWVEVRTTEGRYSDYGLTTAGDGDMEAYISVFARSLADGSAPQAYDEGTSTWVDLTPDAWVTAGLGDVPGTNGGFPYVKHVASVDPDEHQVRTLDRQYRLGEDSIIRVSFRNLAYVGPISGTPTSEYQARVRTLYARKRTLSDAAKTEKWIRVGDISDVVKVILRWAGFKEWEIEDTGVRLPKRLVVSRGMTYMDVINTVKQAVGFIFFVDSPTTDDGSLGVPVWRYNRVVAKQTDGSQIPPLATVTDQDLLTAIDVKFTNAPLAYIIRVRGRESRSGQELGGDPARRVMFTFRPPWALTPSGGIPVAGGPADRLAGIIKHVIKTMPMLRNVTECMFGAYFIALQEALEAYKATIEIPANPELSLDSHVVLKDLGTGLVTRLWISEWRTSSTGGEDAAYTMSVGGALIDTPDVRAMVDIVDAAVRE